MPHNTKEKVRLPHRNLILSALVLNGGGFFCYTLLAPPFRIFAVLSALLGAVLLVGVYLRQQKKSNGNQIVIEQLSQLMAKSDTESPLENLTIAEDSTVESHNLAENYNTMTQNLSESLRRSRQFAANVTHELRTPLTILRGETELALRSNRSKEQLYQVLESNLEEINRMSFLIEDLLLLSKSDLGEIPIRFENLDLTGLILELHHQAKLLAQAKKITVSLNIPQEQVIIQADSLRLRQVLLNLLTNAIKYTPDNGSIELALQKADNHLTIDVKDSGIGISQEHIDRIFDRFYRVDKTRNRNDGGSGLGLAIVKWIVDAHDGEISVTSTPGQGSCFSVKLPCQ